MRWVNCGILLSIGLGVAFIARVDFLYAQSHVPCHVMEYGTTVPANFGVPYSFYNVQELVVSVDCTDTKAIITVGTGSQYEYIYENAYAWTGSSWAPFTLSGIDKAGAWYQGKAVGSLTMGAHSGNAFFVTYMCTWDGSRWRCGCSDVDCFHSFWQMQGYSNPHAT